MKRILLLFTLLSISCQKDSEYIKKKAKIIFTETDVATTYLKSLETDSLVKISDTLLYAASVIINNDYLIFNELRTDDFLHIVKLPEEKYLGKYGNKGKGPGEILVPWRFSKSEIGNLRVLDPKQKKIVEFDMDSLIIKDVFKKEYRLPEFVKDNSNGGIIYDNKIFFLSRQDVSSRFFKTDLDGKNLTGYGELAINNEKIKQSDYNEFSRSDMTNKNNLFVFSYFHLPFIEIFNYDTKEWISIYGPDNSNFSFENFSDITYYPSIKITKNFIYALYIGNENINGNQIFVFSHKGNLVRKIVLEKSIFNFDIYKDKYIYGLHFNKEEETKAVKFEINENF